MLKIENTSSNNSTKKIEESARSAIALLPKEHLRGIERLKIVDTIVEPRLKPTGVSKLPGLYHPRQGTQAAWLEIAAHVLTPPQIPFYKRLIPHLSLKDNTAAVIYSLIGQHYHTTLKHSVKRTQLEMLVRAYTEKYLKLRNERERKLRARVFKPLQPTLERWAKQLQKRAATKRR